MRIDNATFTQMICEELVALGEKGAGFSVALVESPEPQLLCRRDGPLITLHKKPIQALVDTPEAAKEIIRNLLRWATER